MPTNNHDHHPRPVTFQTTLHNPELREPWRATITLPRTPICPLCADPLEPHDLATYHAIAFCFRCAATARDCNWPEPFAITHLFEAPDLILACGMTFYAPRDCFQEPAIARRIRRDAEYRIGPRNASG